jgi:hypothetical protein
MKDQRLIEISVGVFVALGLAALLMLSMKVANLADFSTPQGEIHPIPWAKIDPQLRHAIAHRLHIAGMACRQSFNPDQDASAPLQIVQSVNPERINISFA